MYVEKLSRKRESEKPRERVVSLQLFLPPGHPIIYCEIKLFKMAAVSAKRSLVIFSEFQLIIRMEVRGQGEVGEKKDKLHVCVPSSDYSLYTFTNNPFTTKI